MNIIGAGFGRTGTLSLKTALERLGEGPCAHMLPLIGDDERCRLFLRAAAGELDCLDRAFDGYRATVDWPGAYFWRHLIARHPDAGVILTVRDPREWYASVERTIWAAGRGPAPPEFAVFRRMGEAVVWTGTFDGRFGDRAYAIEVFDRHNAAVRAAVPAGRLLEYRVADGWGPLCDFLGHPVPAEPFPRLNDSATFQEHVRELLAAGEADAR
ncbi:sulfotransferase family protein [Actinoplanes regularis]|uniref:sulfotransferase family protein n=1 Tax=Actinoplanes regularis TaxID=52697 RepID=UPI0024A32556|nr:sulfotransferase family protein [Actinoplanes regularis]GLW28408.1 sulfotransferase family protein [Actinoplanes regularis]